MKSDKFTNWLNTTSQSEAGMFNPSAPIALNKISENNARIEFIAKTMDIINDHENATEIYRISEGQNKEFFAVDWRWELLPFETENGTRLKTLRFLKLFDVLIHTLTLNILSGYIQAMGERDKSPATIRIGRGIGLITHTLAECFRIPLAIASGAIGFFAGCFRALYSFDSRLMLTTTLDGASIFAPKAAKYLSYQYIAHQLPLEEQAQKQKIEEAIDTAVRPRIFMALWALALAATLALTFLSVGGGTPLLIVAAKGFFGAIGVSAFASGAAGAGISTLGAALFSSSFFVAAGSFLSTFYNKAYRLLSQPGKVHLMLWGLALAATLALTFLSVGGGTPLLIVAAKGFFSGMGITAFASGAAGTGISTLGAALFSSSIFLAAGSFLSGLYNAFRPGPISSYAPVKIKFKGPTTSLAGEIITIWRDIDKKIVLEKDNSPPLVASDDPFETAKLKNLTGTTKQFQLSNGHQPNRIANSSKRVVENEKTATR